MTIGSALLLAFAQAASAAELSGTVRDGASAQPLAGAIVLTLDAAGRHIARGMSDERGAYTVDLSPATRALRVLKLGYQPHDFQLSSAPSLPLRHDVTLAPIVRFLDPVPVVADAVCPRTPDQDIAFSLWQEARVGLLATIVARERKPATVSLLVYERALLDPEGRYQAQKVRRTGGRSTTTFTAAHTAAEFLSRGFRRTDPDGGRTYFSPDAEVLMDDAFQAAYCFTLAPADPVRRERVGLRFAPARRGERDVDITGTLWIDTVARVLREIDYRYVGLDGGASRWRPGGRVEFRAMPNGVVVVDQWSIRSVNENRRSNERFFATEIGGEIGSADWPDGTSWRARLGWARIRVVDSRGAPAVGQRVRLEGTDYAAWSDTAGLARIDDLLPGPYTLIAVDTLLVTVGLEQVGRHQFVMARDSTLEATVPVKSAAEVVLAACRRRPEAASGRGLIARVFARDGLPVRSAYWEAAGQSGTTDADGVFVACLRPEFSGIIEAKVWRDRRRSDRPEVVDVPMSGRVGAARIVLQNGKR